MPELPEVECVRLSLERLIVGRRVDAVRVTRPDVVRGDASARALLLGQRIASVLRRGKQLAIVSERGPVVCIHLGMSGQLCVLADYKPRATDLPAHTHLLWRLDGGLAMRFTDPRRFGGVWTLDDLPALLTERWNSLGPDALKITPADLHRRLAATTRGLKPALLDQSLVAGLGNIYVDELLFMAGLHPELPANAVSRAQCGPLVRQMKALLRGAISRGGSTLRDYVDAQNRRGSQQKHHRVYGRSGQPCLSRGCRSTIQAKQIAGRTTSWCPGCQPSGL